MDVLILDSGSANPAGSSCLIFTLSSSLTTGGTNPSSCSLQCSLTYFFNAIAANCRCKSDTEEMCLLGEDEVDNCCLNLCALMLLHTLVEFRIVSVDFPLVYVYRLKVT
jgi:hypothetical protein